MKLHHTAIIPADLEASLRFYRDGLGLEVTMDMEFDGDWPALFGAAQPKLRSIFLGDPADPTGGIVELVQFAGQPTSATGGGSPAMLGVFLLSFNCDVDAVIGRLGVAVEGRIEMPAPNGPVVMATVRDPDGILIELIGI